VAAEVMAAEAAVDQVSSGSPVGWPAGASLDEIQRSLSANAALLDYQRLDRDLLVWAVRRDGVVCWRRGLSRRDLARAVRELHSACVDPAADGERVPDLAAGLAADLIEPVATALTGIDRLFVAPPGNLMLLRSPSCR
jgi:hypothetical protein